MLRLITARTAYSLEHWGSGGPSTQLLPGREDGPCPPAAPSRTRSELQRRPSACPWRIPTRWGDAWGRQSSESGRGRRELSLQILAPPPLAWRDLPGAHQQQKSPSRALCPLEPVSPFGTCSPHRLQVAACSVDSWSLVCLCLGIVAGSLGRSRCWAHPPPAPGPPPQAGLGPQPKEDPPP